MRKGRIVIAVIAGLLVLSIAVDRIVEYRWSHGVFETYYVLEDKHVAAFMATPDHVVVRDNGKVLLVFEPPVLYWSAHLSKERMALATYAIEIGRDQANKPRIRVLQELD